MARNPDRNEVHVAVTMDQERLSELKALAQEADVSVARLVRHRLRLFEKAPVKVPGKTTKTSFRLPRPLLERLKAHASRIGIPHCELVALLLEQWNLEKFKSRMRKRKII